MYAYVNIVAVCVVVCCIFFDNSETAQSRKPIPPALDRLIYPGDLDFPGDFYNHQHHIHPEDEDYDDASNQKPSTASTANINAAIDNIWGVSEKNQSTKIPLTFINELNNNEYAINDLLLHYVDGYNDFEELESRFSSGERSSPIITPLKEQTKCMPELRTVDLIEDTDPTVLYIPSCMRIERCGGCCMHNLLACQPTKVETVNVKIIKVSYTNTAGKKLKYPQKHIVPVDKHVACKCDCKITAADCTPVQVYEKSECRCNCRNTDEEKKCLKENSTKLWNPEACACQCREELKCTTGSVFDWRECKCVVKQVRRRNVQYSYRHNGMQVIPLADNF